MSKRALRDLDFDRLPVIESMDIFIRLDRATEAMLAERTYFQEVVERAQAALMFFFQTKDNDSRVRNDARLRAGLNEFYSIEDAAVRDLRAAGIRSKPPRLCESANPLVHLLYMLRHAGVHSAPIASEVATVNVVSEVGGVRHDYSYEAAILESLTVEHLMRSREVAEHYRPSDLEALLDWAKEAQRVFGIAEVFRRGLNSYVQEILRATAPHDA
jgi:hypothetical protein